MVAGCSLGLVGFGAKIAAGSAVRRASYLPIRGEEGGGYVPLALGKCHARGILDGGEDLEGVRKRWGEGLDRGPSRGRSRDPPTITRHHPPSR